MKIINFMKHKVLITAKSSPDLDGVACALAYSSYLEQVNKKDTYFPGFEGDIQVEVKYALKLVNAEVPRIKNNKFSSFILVDTSSTKGLPKVVVNKRVVELVDHRSGGIEYESFPNAKAQIELVGAAATLIAEKYYFNNIELNEKNAMLLYLAIFSNTLNLKASVTTYRDIRIIKWIEGKYSRFTKEIVKSMLNNKTRVISNNLEFALNSDSKQIVMGGKSVGVYQLEVNGIHGLIPDKIKEIQRIMSSDKSIDWAFCTIADMDSGRNILLSTDNKYNPKLQAVLGALDKKDYLITKELFLRKEIVPKLRVVFD